MTPYDIDVRNKSGDHLGTIKWRAGWRRYVFTPDEHTVFDASCLKEIVACIARLMKARAKKSETIEDRLAFAQEHWVFTFEMQELYEFVMFGEIPKDGESEKHEQTNRIQR